MMVQNFCYKTFIRKGWKFINNVPQDIKSFVLIGAPHTSNYDFFAAMAIAGFMKKNARFVIKNEWVKFPFSLVMKPLGAYGLDRDRIKASQGLNTTDLMADLFKKEKEFVLMITPEGTRRPNNRWKTGFYYVAEKAQVPIVLGFADYSKKVLGLGLVIYPHDFNSDMKAIMDFYRNITGKVPTSFQLDSRFV